jgi:hypothetical protein
MLRRRAAWIRALVTVGGMAGILSGAVASGLHAQQPPVLPTRPATTKSADTVPTARQVIPTQRRPGTPDDTVKGKTRPTLNFVFDAPDSTMRELMARQGFRQVLYQGGRVLFNAQSKVIILKGKPSAKRDETMLVGDPLLNDSTKKVAATGDSVGARPKSAGRPTIFCAQAHRLVRNALRTNGDFPPRWSQGNVCS